LAVLWGVLFFMPATLMAAEPAWPVGSYEYVVVDQDLRVVLQQFGSNTGLRIALSDAVQGRVHGRLPSAPPREFLNHLAQVYALDWYFDGVEITISAASETQTHVLPLQSVKFQKLYDSLAAAALLDDARYPLRSGLDSDTLVVSGPPRFITMVQQTIVALAAVKAPAPKTPSGATLVIFRGSSVSNVQFP
jgi:type III secretion protein C